MSATIMDQVVRIVREVTHASAAEALPATALKSLDIDSLDTQELVMELEDCFDIDVRDDEFGACKTVAALEQLVRRRKGLGDSADLAEAFGAEAGS